MNLSERVGTEGEGEHLAYRLSINKPTANPTIAKINIPITTVNPMIIPRVLSLIPPPSPLPLLLLVNEGSFVVGVVVVVVVAVV